MSEQLTPAMMQQAQQQHADQEQQRLENVRRILAQLPPEPLEVCQRMRNKLAEIIMDENKNPFWPAILVAVSVINAVEALKLQMTNKPDAHANVKAFQDLMIGLEANGFYQTHRAQLWPVMNSILQETLDAIQIGAGIANADLTNKIDQVLIDRAFGASYQIIPAVLFCIGGMPAVREHSIKLRRAFFKDMVVTPVRLQASDVLN